MTNLLIYLTNGKFDWENHTFEITPLNLNDDKLKKNKKIEHVSTRVEFKILIENYLKFIFLNRTTLDMLS